jgi:hypothetical protein
MDKKLELEREATKLLRVNKIFFDGTKVSSVKAAMEHANQIFFENETVLLVDRTEGVLQCSKRNALLRKPKDKEI